MRQLKVAATSQSIYLFIQDSTSSTGGGLTGLAFNSAGITGYYVINGAAAVAITLATLASASAAWATGGFVEVDATHAPGLYRLDLPNAAIASGASVVIYLQGATHMVQTVEEIMLTAYDPQDAVALGLSMVPVNVSKFGGTSVTGRDLGASVLLSPGTGTGQLDITAGVVKANLVQILATALTETAGQLAAGFKKFFNVTVPTLTVGGTDQSGDNYPRLGAPAGASIAADILTTNTRLTAARAGYLDNLNVGGNVASHADVLAINTSSSKHIILTTVGQYERPESSTTVYTVEARTFAAADGSAVNADTTPTLTATGQTTGSLAANLGAATNPAAGVYRWTYTVNSTDNIEPIRFDISAAIAAVTFTLSAYTQVVDDVSATFTSTDKSNLTSIFNKLPAANIADETVLTQVKAKTDLIGTTGADSSNIVDIKTQADKISTGGVLIDGTSIAQIDDAVQVAIESTTVTVGAYASGQDPATLVWNALTVSFDTANTFGHTVQNISGGGGGTDVNLVSINGVAIIGPVTLNYMGALAPAGDLLIYRGTTYKALYGTGIDFTLPSALLPDWSTATIQLRDNGTVISTGSVTTVGSNKKIVFELDDSATSLLGVYTRDYDIAAFFSGADDTVVLAPGKLTVQDP